MKWVNLGGGHHITRKDYDVERLIRIIRHLKETYGVQVYLEPGEAVVLNAGYLVSEVLEILENGMNLAILDTSAACHMPDVLEMPYRPPVRGAGNQGKKTIPTDLEAPPVWPGM
ncbi:carboxynorspermidine decarboxylase [gut metagenome]|uniref:Carboxynorspermidine decarboxylase n=1 Tax=gut metagenome TaxID=749906 RepID=J9GEQ7_9ZZZZ